MRTIKSILSVVIIIASLNGCAKEGGFSKEGAYEALRSFDKSHNPSIDNGSQDDMSYREYENLREENDKKQKSY